MLSRAKIYFQETHFTPCLSTVCAAISDVKRGQNLEAEAEARATRPRRGRGQFLEVEAKAEAKNNYENIPNND